MPYSSVVGKDWLREMLSKLSDLPQPVQIIDVGPGAGAYRDLLDGVFPGAEWFAIEIWGPYVEKFNLKQRYDMVIVGDVRYIAIERLTQPGPIVILGDILEHMNKDDAAQLLHDVWFEASYIVVSVPLGEYPQGAEEGNPYEEHVQTYQPGEIPNLMDGIQVWAREADGIGAYIIVGAMA